MTPGFEVRVCDNPSCGLRYPLPFGHPFGERCPLCLGSTTIALTRELIPELPSSSAAPILPLQTLVDNVRSAWNVGAIFRTSDCFGVDKIYLCGITPTPAQSAVQKTALGADLTVDWEYSRNALQTATQLANKGYHLWALEQDQRAVLINSTIQTDSHPVVLVLGNEVSGVDPGILDLCERIMYIPMLGKKRSLNVEVAYGAALAVIRSSSNPTKQNQ